MYSDVSNCLLVIRVSVSKLSLFKAGEQQILSKFQAQFRPVGLGMRGVRTSPSPRSQKRPPIMGS